MASGASGKVSAMPHTRASIGRKKTSRKSGTPKRLTVHAGKTRDEEQLYEKIIKAKEIGLHLMRAEGRKPEPLLVYGYLPFPILFEDYTAKRKKRVPRWDQLSDWMKLQIIILAFQEWKRRFVTYNVNLNSKRGAEIVLKELDVRRYVRDRIRKRLAKALGARVAYFFTIEGTSRRTKDPTNLHIHGGVWLSNPAEQVKVLKAIEKGMAQGVRGYTKDPRAMVPRPFYGGGANFGNYITKFTHVADTRLRDRRVTFSGEAIAAGRELWAIITGRFDGVSLDRLKREQGIDQD